MVIRLMFHLSLLVALASPLYGTDEVIPTNALDVDAALTQQELDAAFAAKKEKALGAESKGRTQPTPMDLELAAALKRYKGSRYLTEKAKITAKFFWGTFWETNTKYIQRQVNLAVVNTLRRGLREQFLLKMSHPAFRAAFQKNFPTPRNEDFASFFQSKIAEQFYQEVRRYARISFLAESIEKDLKFQLVDSEKKEDELRGLLKQSDDSPLDTFFKFPPSYPLIEGENTIDVGFQGIAGGALEVLRKRGEGRKVHLEAARVKRMQEQQNAKELQQEQEERAKIATAAQREAEKTAKLEAEKLRVEALKAGRLAQVEAELQEKERQKIAAAANSQAAKIAAAAQSNAAKIEAERWKAEQEEQKRAIQNRRTQRQEEIAARKNERAPQKIELTPEQIAQRAKLLKYAKYGVVGVLGAGPAVAAGAVALATAPITVPSYLAYQKWNKYQAGAPERAKRAADLATIQTDIQAKFSGEKGVWMSGELTKRIKKWRETAQPKGFILPEQIQECEGLWDSYATMKQAVAQRCDALETADYPKGGLADRIRVNQLQLLSGLREVSFAKHQPWSVIQRELTKILHRTTTEYNHQFWRQQRPVELGIGSKKEEQVWRDIQKQPPLKPLDAPGFVSAVVSQFRKQVNQGRIQARIKEFTEPMLPEKKKLAVRAKKTAVAINMVEALSLSTEIEHVYDNLQLIESGKSNLTDSLVAAGKERAEVNEKMEKGLWEIFLELKQTQGGFSSDMALAAWTQLEKETIKSTLVDLLDIDRAYQDRFVQLNRPTALVVPGVTTEKSVVDAGSTPEKVEELSSEETEAQFKKNNYLPFPPRISSFFDRSTTCSCGEELKFVMRPLRKVSKGSASSQWVQVPLPGTHKLSTCGHLICDSCLEGWKISKLRAVELYDCPTCRVRIPYWETDRKKWEAHFGIQYGKALADETMSFHDLRQAELGQLRAELQQRLSKRLNGAGLEVGGVFYQKIRSGSTLSKESKAMLLAEWTRGSDEIQPQFSEEKEPNFDAYFNLYQNTQAKLEALYAKMAAKISWKLYQPSMKNTRIRAHMKQYEFSASTDQIDSPEIDEKIKAIEKTSTTEFFDSVSAGWRDATVDSADSFRQHMQLSGIKEKWTPVQQNFEENTKKELATYQGAQSYRIAAYQLLKAASKKTFFVVSESIDEQAHTSILPVFTDELLEYWGRIIETMVREVEARDQRISAQYQQLNSLTQPAAAGVSLFVQFSENVEEQRKKFKDLLQQHEAGMEAKVTHFHWKSFYLYTVESLFKKADDFIVASKPKDEEHLNSYAAASERFMSALKEKTNCSENALNLMTEMDAKLYVEKSNEGYTCEKTKYEHAMEPFLDKEKVQSTIDEEIKLYKEFVLANRKKINEVLPSVSAVFSPLCDVIYASLQTPLFLENKSLDVVRSEVAKQRELQKNIQEIAAWNQFSIEKELDAKYLFLRDLTIYLQEDLAGNCLSQFALYREESESTYKHMLLKIPSERDASEYCAFHRGILKEMENQFLAMLKKTEKDLTQTFDVKKDYKKWKTFATDKKIKNFLKDIGSVKLEPFKAVQLRLMLYVGSYLAEAENSLHMDLKKIYMQKRAEMKKNVLPDDFSTLPVVEMPSSSGLHNFGATCYLNSIYQSFALTELYALLLPIHEVEEGKEELQSRLYRLANAIREGWSIPDITPLVQETNETVWRTFSHVDSHVDPNPDSGVAPDVNPESQHRDLSEYLGYILDGLNAKDRSEIQYYRVTHKLVEEKPALQKDILQILPLELVDYSIPAILAQMKNVEIADGGDGPTHHIWSGISALPKVLFISLKRFKFVDENLTKKDTHRVVIPSEMTVNGRRVDLTQEREPISKKYRLAGIYLHYEGQASKTGHYTFLQPIRSGPGFMERDDKVARAQTGTDFLQFVEENAYVVMYTEILSTSAL